MMVRQNHDEGTHRIHKAVCKQCRLCGWLIACQALRSGAVASLARGGFALQGVQKPYNAQFLLHRIDPLLAQYRISHHLLYFQVCYS